ncbi:MAG: hypothetical protein R3E91_00030 [Chlamydiales bacterium]
MGLIIAKDYEERRRLLHTYLKKTVGPRFFFKPEQFREFLEEIETLSCISKSKIVVLQDLDLLKKEQFQEVINYVNKPNPSIDLYLTTACPPVQIQVFKKLGPIIHLKEEKPWEKEKRLIQWVIEEAAAAGVILVAETAQTFVRRVDSHFLKEEIEKLICYVGKKHEITNEDIDAVCIPVHHETLWELGQAIFTKRPSLAIHIGQILIEDGMVLLPLIAHLRTQFHTALKMVNLYHLHGKGAVLKEFPYLKGELIDKKISIFKDYGLERLKQGIMHLFEAELKAKNSHFNPIYLLEILIFKVSYATLSPTKFTRFC